VFVFNATSLMTGNTMRFGRAYVADYRIGVLEGHAYEVGGRCGAMWGLGTGANHPTDIPPLLTPQEAADARSVLTRL
jgi:hypothetical protein